MVDLVVAGVADPAVEAGPAAVVVQVVVVAQAGATTVEGIATDGKNCETISEAGMTFYPGLCFVS